MPIFLFVLKVSKSAIHESIARLLEDVEDSMRSDSEIDGRFLGYSEPLVVKCDAGIQTDNDPITDEAPEFAARPPPCKKKEMIPCMSIFKEVDRRVLEVGNLQAFLTNYPLYYMGLNSNICIIHGQPRYLQRIQYNRFTF